MKRFVFAALLLAFSMTAHGAEEPLAKGMKLYEKRRLREAEAVLLEQLSSSPPARQGAFHLGLGMTYLKNAEFHRELFKTSSTIYPEYLKRLKGNGSRVAPLYAGEALLAAGKPKEALALLEPYVASASPGKNRQLAEISLLLCRAALGEAQKGKEELIAMQPADPEVTAALAAALVDVGAGERDPEQMCESAITAAKKSGKLPMRVVKGCLAVYAEKGRIDKGLSLLKMADLKACSLEETVGKNKVIFFYDLALLRDLSALYGKAALMHLVKAAADPRLKETAQYYLAEAHVKFGDAEDGARFAKAVQHAAQLPPQLKSLAAIYEAEASYRRGSKAEAISTWESLAQKHGSDPVVLAEAVLAATRCRADAAGLIQKASAAVDKGDGKRFAPVSAALGRYHFGRKDNPKALAFMEAGRDKANKNKIEANDLLLLVNLAEGYYRTKKFSEAQEIYFEMSKQFPQVRQIQDALQGIYSREQKSAGDVRIF